MSLVPVGLAIFIKPNYPVDGLASVTAISNYCVIDCGRERSAEL